MAFGDILKRDATDEVASGLGTVLGGGLALAGQSFRKRTSLDIDERKRLGLREKVAFDIGLEDEIPQLAEKREAITNFTFDTFLKGKGLDKTGKKPPVKAQQPIKPVYPLVGYSNQLEENRNRLIANGFTGSKIDNAVKNLETAEGIADLEETTWNFLDKAWSGIENSVGKQLTIKQLILQDNRKSIKEERGVEAKAKMDPVLYKKLYKEYNDESKKKQKEYKEYIHKILPGYDDLLRYAQILGRANKQTDNFMKNVGAGPNKQKFEKTTPLTKSVEKYSQLFKSYKVIKPKTHTGVPKDSPILDNILAWENLISGEAVVGREKMQGDILAMRGAFVKGVGNIASGLINGINGLSRDSTTSAATLPGMQTYLIGTADNIFVEKPEYTNSQTVINTIRTGLKDAEKLTGEEKNRALRSVYDTWAKAFTLTRTRMLKEALPGLLSSRKQYTKSAYKDLLANEFIWQEFDGALYNLYYEYIKASGEKFRLGLIKGKK